MSEYIRTNKIDPNECPNKYSCPIYSNIRIFKYIRHTLVWSGLAWKALYPEQSVSKSISQKVSYQGRYIAAKAAKKEQ